LKVLVTGSNSPLGTFIVSKILESYKDCHIFALSRSNTIINNPRVTNLVFDITKDQLDLDEKFDLVIHAAACVPKAAKSESEILETNLYGSLKLFEEIKLNNDSLIFNISSSSVYDDPFEKVLMENSKKTSTNIYGLSKLRFEEALEELFKEHLVKVLTIRIPVLLVKGVKNNFFSGWLDSIKASKPISLFNPSSLFNACVHAEDIFKFLYSYLQDPVKKHLICNLSSSTPITIKEAAKILSDEINAGFKFNEEATNKPAQLISSDLAEKYGFQPRSVEQSIRDFAIE
tara:strand:- start:1451 stop:2314 length:864 start_codon:yes stop_codon:yes gene_type:complete